jgi:hypothetical protein
VENLLRKLIKYDFKTQWIGFALVFALSLAAPVVVWLLTPGYPDNNDDYIIRSILSTLIPSAVIIITVLMGIAPFANDFGGDGAYLLLTVPAKIKSQIASKTIVFYVWSILAVIFANLGYALIYMDFESLNFSVNRIGERMVSLFSEGGINTAISFITESINLLSIPLFFFGFMIAAIAFGHLCGTRKKFGKAAFVIGFTLLFIALLSVLQLCKDAVYHQIRIMTGERFSHLMTSASAIFGTAVLLIVTFSLYRFTHWVYTKRINVL